MSKIAKTILIVVGVVGLAALVLSVFGVGIAYAKNSLFDRDLRPWGDDDSPGWMDGGRGRRGPGGRGMGFEPGAPAGAWHSMPAWGGQMHASIWQTLTQTLGLTEDELAAQLQSGQSLAQIAEAQGVSREDLLAALQTAHQQALEQAVADGRLTQEQADALREQMAARYEWMIDRAGFGRMGGGMRGGGRGGPGGCYGGPFAPTPEPAP